MKKNKFKNKSLIVKFLCGSFALVGALCLFLFGGAKTYAYELQDNGILVSQNLTNISNSVKNSNPSSLNDEILLNEGAESFDYETYVILPTSYQNDTLDPYAVVFNNNSPSIVALDVNNSHYETITSVTSHTDQLLQLYTLNMSTQVAAAVEIKGVSYGYSGPVAVSFDYDLIRFSYGGVTRYGYCFHNIMISETSYVLPYENPDAAFISYDKYTEDVADARSEGYDTGYNAGYTQGEAYGHSQGYNEGYEDGKNTSIVYSMFGGSNCRLYSKNNNTLVAEDVFSGNLNVGSVSLENYPAVYSFINNFDSSVEDQYGAYYYAVIIFANYASYKTPLTVTLDNTVVETSVSIYSGNSLFQFLQCTYTRELNSYQIYVNQDPEGYMYSFTHFRFEDLYLPDYGNFTVNVSFDGIAYNKGYSDGVNASKSSIYQEAYEAGKQAGITEAINQDVSQNGFRTLFGTILSYPVNMIRSAFDFSIFGINISSLLMFIASIVIVGFIIKKFWK